MPRQQGNSRLRIISSRVTAEQYAVLLGKANEEGLSVSEYVRLRSLAGPEGTAAIEYLLAVMAEICSLRTILTYTVANLTTGREIDATFMKELSASADSSKYEQANLRLAQARLRRVQEPEK